MAGTKRVGRIPLYRPTLPAPTAAAAAAAATAAVTQPQKTSKVLLRLCTFRIKNFVPSSACRPFLLSLLENLPSFGTMGGDDSFISSSPSPANSSSPGPKLECYYLDDTEPLTFVSNILLFLLVIIGILTNILNIVVLSRPSIQGSTYRYLVWLALVDLLVCASVLVSLVRINYKVCELPFALAFLQAYVELPLTNALFSSSAYIVVGLSIDRYIAVCHPQHYNSVTSLQFANVRIAVSIIFSFVLYLPHAFLYQTVGETEDGLWVVAGNDKVNHSTWWRAWEVILELCHRIVPSLILVVLNLRIIHTFSGLSSKRKRMTSNSGLHKKNGSPPEESSSLLDGTLKKVREALTRKECGSVKDNRSVQDAENHGMKSAGHTTAGTNNVTPNGGSHVTSSRVESSIGNLSKKTQSDLHKTREQQERRLVVLLLAIIVTFLTTNLPASVLALMDYAGMQKSVDYKFEVFRTVANCMELLNFSLNFVLYFIFSREIRRGYLSFFSALGSRCRQMVPITRTQACYSSNDNKTKDIAMV